MDRWSYTPYEPSGVKHPKYLQVWSPLISSLNSRYLLFIFRGIGGMVSDYLCDSDHGLFSGGSVGWWATICVTVIMVYFQGDRWDGERLSVWQWSWFIFRGIGGMVSDYLCDSDHGLFSGGSVGWWATTFTIRRWTGSGTESWCSLRWERWEVSDVNTVTRVTRGSVNLWFGQFLWIRHW